VGQLHTSGPHFGGWGGVLTHFDHPWTINPFSILILAAIGGRIRLMLISSRSPGSGLSPPGVRLANFSAV